MGRLVFSLFLVSIFCFSCKTDFETRKYTHGRVSWKYKNDQVITDINNNLPETDIKSIAVQEVKLVDPDVYKTDQFIPEVKTGNEEVVQVLLPEKDKIKTQVVASQNEQIIIHEVPTENSIRIKTRQSIFLGITADIFATIAIYLIFTSGSVLLFAFLLAGLLMSIAGLKKALSAKMDIDKLSKRSQIKKLDKSSSVALALNVLGLAATALFVFLYLLSFIF